MPTDLRQLFSISQAAKACGLSRSTLLRLEQKGLLTPAYVAPDSGRRYYDNHNVSRILQLQQFQKMGFTTAQIQAYYASSGDAQALLAAAEQKLAALQKHLSELRLRAKAVPNFTFEMQRLPESVCCVRRLKGLTVSDKYDGMYKFFHACVARGVALAPEPLFLINERTDYLEGQITQTPYDFLACVPVVPEKAPPDAVRFPACNAFSMLVYGGYGNQRSVWLQFGHEIRRRGLTPAGYPRVIAVVAPYTGREIAPNSYCTWLVQPVQD